MQNRPSTGACQECGGKGSLACTVCHGQGRQPSSSGAQRPCPNCHGRGTIICPKCRGTKKAGTETAGG